MRYDKVDPRSTKRNHVAKTATKGNNSPQILTYRLARDFNPPPTVLLSNISEKMDNIAFPRKARTAEKNQFSTTPLNRNKRLQSSSSNSIGEHINPSNLPVDNTKSRANSGLLIYFRSPPNTNHDSTDQFENLSTPQDHLSSTLDNSSFNIIRKPLNFESNTIVRERDK